VPFISALFTAVISIFNQTAKPEARDEMIGWG